MSKQERDITISLPDRHVEPLFQALTGGLSQPEPDFNKVDMTGGVQRQLSGNLPLNPVRPQPQQQNPDYLENLKNVLSNPPLKSNYPPSTTRRVLGAITGGLTGFAGGPQVGIQSAEAITDKPYRDAYQDWLVKSGALEKGAGLEIAAKRAQFSGLTGVGSYLRALEAGDVGLQGRLAAAKDAAKTPSMIREFNIWKMMPGNELENYGGDEQKAYEDFLSTRRYVTQRISSQMVTADSAKERANKGETFKDISGNIINTNDLKPTEGLVLIGGNAKDQRYERVDQQLKEFTAGNIRTLFGARSGPFEAPVAEGPARVSSTHEQVTFDPTQNKEVAQKLVTAPSTPGFTGPAVNPPTNINQAAPQVTPPISQTSQPRNSIPAPQVPKVNSPTSSNPTGNRTLNTLSQATMNRASKYAPPATAAFSQLLGSPTDPSSEGLADFAYLMDDKGSKERTGQAIRTLIDELYKSGGSDNDIGLSVMGYGGGARTGGIWEWLRNSTGITAKMEQARAKVIDDAFANLKTDDERRFVDKYFSTIGSIAGFRSTIGQAGYQWANEQMRKEVGAAGVSGSNDSKEFINKIANFAREADDGLKSAHIPDVMFTENGVNKLDYWDNKTKELTQMGLGQKPIPGKKTRYLIREVK